ncbi:GMC oxidoreductase-domain-containing protein, partial [Rhypophila decipiens]
TTATGVELDDGTKITANKNFILAAGAYRTPQILMLSGTGPSSTLSEHGIPLVHDSPEFGKNLHDHFAVYFAFRLRDPSQGYAFGSNHAAWQNPASFKYLPWDWVVSEPLPRDLLPKQHGLSSSSQPEKEEEPRNPYEVITLYIPPGIPGIPMDGTHIATSTMLLRPTSRGEVSIRSKNPSDNPLIQPGYLQTELDKITLTHAARQTLRAFLSTDAMRSITESEAPPQIPGLEGGTLLPPLKADSSDEEIEKRVKMTGSQHHHSGGTAAMGKVVDSCGRVIGVSRLSIVDASIVPIPLGGHPQATLYAMAEQLAHFII